MFIKSLKIGEKSVGKSNVPKLEGRKEEQQLTSPHELQILIWQSKVEKSSQENFGYEECFREITLQ